MLNFLFIHSNYFPQQQCGNTSGSLLERTQEKGEFPTRPFFVNEIPTPSQVPSTPKLYVQNILLIQASLKILELYCESGASHGGICKSMCFRTSVNFSFSFLCKIFDSLSLIQPTFNITRHYPYCFCGHDFFFFFYMEIF